MSMSGLCSLRQLLLVGVISFTLVIILLNFKTTNIQLTSAVFQRSSSTDAENSKFYELRGEDSQTWSKLTTSSPSKTPATHYQKASNSNYGNLSLSHSVPHSSGSQKVLSISSNFSSTVQPVSLSSMFLLKTHKTGGSAVQNIVLRQALFNNLSVGLSSSGRDWSRLCAEKVFSKDCFCNKEQIPLDIVAHHMVFNQAQVRSSTKRSEYILARKLLMSNLKHVLLAL